MSLSMSLNTAISFLSEEKSLFEELYEYIKDRYFTVHLGTYSNFNFGSGTLVTPTVIIVGIMIGVMIAGLLAIRDRNQLGGFVRTILREKCLSPETAKTYSELGYDRSFMIRMSMQYGKRLRSVVHCVETETVAAPEPEVSAGEPVAEDAVPEEQTDAVPAETPAEPTADPQAEQPVSEAVDIQPTGSDAPAMQKPQRWDNDSFHFYIPEDKAIEADIRFEKKGTNWLVYLALVVGVLALTLAVIYFLPDLLQFADNAITMIKGGN